MIWTITLWVAMQGCFVIGDHMFCNSTEIHSGGSDGVLTHTEHSVEIHEAKLGTCKALTDGPNTAQFLDAPPPCSPAAVWETPLEPSTGFLLPPRAEHVFEIRPKQKLTGLTEICSNVSFTGNPCSTIPTPMYCPDGNYCKEIIDVTRELWMDGKKLGIIKGDLQ